MDLKFKVAARISRPVHEVFEAVADPDKLSHYFTTGGAKGRLELVQSRFSALDDVARQCGHESVDGVVLAMTLAPALLLGIVVGAVPVLVGNLRQGLVQHADVIGGGVRAGIARP